MCETQFIKKEPQTEDIEGGNNDTPSLSYEEKVINASVIANPMASKKVATRIYKLVKKASKKRKTNMRMGLKLVQSKVRKGERGIVIMAGDVAPVDVICHMPAVCEEKDLPYIFVPSKMDLGSAAGSLGPVQIVLIIKDQEFEEPYDKVLEAIKIATQQ